MIDLGWIDAIFKVARPQVMGALLRYFRDLDTAQEAFQEACLRALRLWPQKGPPRDPAAWLILVGQNAALDDARKRARDCVAWSRSWLRVGRWRHTSGYRFTSLEPLCLAVQTPCRTPPSHPQATISGHELVRL